MRGRGCWCVSGRAQHNADDCLCATNTRRIQAMIGAICLPVQIDDVHRRYILFPATN
jgi:hypothetical protein